MFIALIFSEFRNFHYLESRGLCHLVTRTGIATCTSQLRTTDKEGMSEDQGFLKYMKCSTRPCVATAVTSAASEPHDRQTLSDQ